MKFDSYKWSFNDFILNKNLKKQHHNFSGNLNLDYQTYFNSTILFYHFQKNDSPTHLFPYFCKRTNKG
ncbi:hypothetical protein EM308_03490 [Flavobacterium gilvum]|uniref:Uncharacterized protein n=1 Tax=Flavobacterium gilvum TaxID=1492737 RepID=A0AAC9N4Q9_9FLAO|nr:hypothetical protein EM308_03490 [Flavobacterium gilvum]KFC59734.1 hypothetical protein FEM08_15150 [Flavobacterium gilvum]